MQYLNKLYINNYYLNKLCLMNIEKCKLILNFKLILNCLNI